MQPDSTAAVDEGETGTRVRASGLAIACGFLACLATLAGFADRLWWPFELATHFRIQYFLLLGVLALVLACAGRRRWALVFGLLAALNVTRIAPLFLAVRGEAEESAPRVRVALLNVLTTNTEHDRALERIRQLEPDILVVLEINERWRAELERVSDRYPHSIVVPQPDNFGIGLFSRSPFESSQKLYLGGAGVPSVLAQVRVGGRGLTILGTHAPPPIGASAASARDEHLDAVVALVRTVDGPLVVLGDLNCTPFSARFRDLLRDAGLRNSGAGRGVQATWPAGLPAPLRIPIDHSLHSRELHVLDRDVGASFGSDHLPLVGVYALVGERESDG